jgi:hypothetical protein
MELFELIDIMFSNPKEYANVTKGDKKKHFFLINRRMAIQFPLQAHMLQHNKINDAATVDFWQLFVSKKYSKTPYWMFVKGVKKNKEEKEKKTSIKEASIKKFATFFKYDIKTVKEAIEMFPEEMKKEINNFQKIVTS